MAIIGNTIRITAEFRDFDDNFCDPEYVQLNIYDTLHRQIGDTVMITDKYKKGTGIYEYYYTVPDGAGSLLFEIIGSIEGNDAVGRGTITRVWSNT